MRAGTALADALDQRWARAGSRLAIREDRAEVSFRELLHWSHTISQSLESSVRDIDQRVAVLLPNSAAFVASFVGIARLGAVVAPLSPRYRQQELTYFLNDLEPAAVVTHRACLGVLETVRPTLRSVPALIDVGDHRDPRMVSPGSSNRAPVDTGESAPLVQLYTSGSVGDPKRVIRTHAAVTAELEALQQTFSVEKRDRFLGAAPFVHVNGLIRTMLTAMYAGSTLYPVDEFRRRECLSLITNERLTFFGAVPHMISLLSQTPVHGNVDLSSLRILFSSSAPLLAADNARFQARYGVFARQLYGCSETGTISFNSGADYQSRLDSVGTPIDSVSVDVVDEEQRSLPAGAEGELVIRSPFAVSEYVGNPSATRDSFRHGDYLSGDLGVKDASGYLRLTGRKKLLINRGGFKVNPYEVEAAIKDYPKVQDVMVYSAPGAHGDDLVHAVIVAAEPCTTHEILRHCQTRIADFKVPSRIEFREDLPRSAAGKVLRSKR